MIIRITGDVAMCGIKSASKSKKRQNSAVWLIEMNSINDDAKLSSIILIRSNVVHASSLLDQSKLDVCKTHLK